MEVMPASWSLSALDVPEKPFIPRPEPSSWLSGVMPAFSPTWVNFVACIIFQATVCLLCVHEGPTIVHRFAEIAPRILGRWLQRKGDGAAGGGGTTAAHGEVDVPLSVAQSWKLGALRERFARARDESNLREAGDVLGRPRPLTEVHGRYTWRARKATKVAPQRSLVTLDLRSLVHGDIEWPPCSDFLMLASVVMGSRA